MRIRRSTGSAERKKRLLLFTVSVLIATAASIGYIYAYVTPGTVVGKKPIYMPTKTLPVCDYGGSLTGGPTDWDDLKYGAENMPCYIPKDAAYF